ncbi:hypothetical protein HPDP_00273 [Candidatus Hepatincola sp. Pdp]
MEDTTAILKSIQRTVRFIAIGVGIILLINIGIMFYSYHTLAKVNNVVDFMSGGFLKKLRY